ncbi:uncharacterized protein LOC130273681 isoform X2 [Hyla sarda]|uniref:uncharacterized protein LOC130273681 isoform X2 n=1 Tax=Hyla sarda TaxID=327740 RepID=UPI0024C22E60|nr:uncharacterized protein LOC130273681 isoform X2 [Hyla sarda]
MMEQWFICAIYIALVSPCTSIPQCQHYLSRRREGVFHYDRHIRYQLNYHNAQEACVQDFGGKIATRDQLEKALKSGLEECRAGWITSMEVAYPRVNKHWNCGENKTGIISYGIRQNLQEKWDVFCYKEDDDCSHYDKAFFKESRDNTESPSDVPVTHELSFTSVSSPTIFTLLSANIVPKRGNINRNLPKERKPSDSRKIYDSEDQEKKSFESYFLSVNFSKHKESLKEQGIMLLNTTSELNGTSDTFENNQNNIDKIILPVTNLTNSTYVPVSMHDTQTKSYFSTRDKGSNVGMDTKTPPNSSLSREDNVSNSILHKTGPNINTYKMMVRKEKFDASPLSPLAATTQNAGLYDTTFSSSNFITGESTVPNVNFSIPTASEIETYFPDRGQTTTDLYGTDYSSISHPYDTTHKKTFNINSSQSHTEIMQTVADNLFTQEQKPLIATTPYPLSLAPKSPSILPYKGNENFGKDQQSLFNGQKTEKEIIAHASKNPLGFTEQPTATENQAGLLHLTTDHITAQYRTFFDTYPTPASRLYYNEREVSLADSENNTSTELTPTSNFEIETNIDDNKDTIRGTQENQKAVVEVLTPEEKRTSPTTAISSKVSAEVESSKHSKSISPTTSSFFTPYDHMKVTPSLTPQNNVTNLSLDSCGGWLKAFSGQFHSPGFPQSYEKDMNCIWVIEVPLGYYVILEFLSLVIEEHRNCEYDYVMAYDGMESDQRVLGRFCGSQLPPRIHASSNVMTVIMRSDSSVEMDGISVQFWATQTLSGVSLTEGKNSLEGVVEIEYQGIRGNICAKQWTNNEAQVVCRQLGFTGPAIATRIIGDDSASWAISFVSCNGKESALENCSVKNTGLCGTRERAAVICQVYTSCANLKNAGVQESGTYTIDPDGVGQGESDFPVECDMASDSTTGITIVGHDSEGKERVSSCQTPGCYSRVITYKATSLAQLYTLTSISEHCEQFVKLDCRHVRFLDGPWGWWVSRDGEQIHSWGGASTNSGRCACGENGECALGTTTCNCDAYDNLWRMDEGAITDKSTLPIQEFRFGGTSNVPLAMVFHRIGKLRCWGTKPPVLESCAALKEAGITDSGRYIIDPDGVHKGVPKFEVFCDMSSHSGITVIGHNSERRMPVSPCEEAGCYRRELIYSADLLQLNALTKVSQSCEQFVRLDCRHLRFIQSGWGWWASWDGKRMDYWGGADPSIGGCACGRTGTCSSPDKLCNCDSNDNIWRTDDGFLRDKTALPIRAVYFGDTNDFPLEMAYHTIGKLRCRGRGIQKS